jgi:hypothetical protein
MIEKTLDITTKDSEMENFVCHPERDGRPGRIPLPHGRRPRHRSSPEEIAPRYHA